MKGTMSNIWGYMYIQEDYTLKGVPKAVSLKVLCKIKHYKRF